MEKHKFFLIVNPIAGHGRCHALFPAIRKELSRRGVEFDHHFTNEPMEAADIAQMVIEKGFTHVVAVGGDGTVNEVVNGMQEVGSSQPLAVIPAGRGNDFCRMNGIPLDPVAAIDVLLHGYETTIDLGLVEGDRYFVTAWESESTQPWPETSSRQRVCAVRQHTSPQRCAKCSDSDPSL